MKIVRHFANLPNVYRMSHGHEYFRAENLKDKATLEKVLLIIKKQNLKKYSITFKNHETFTKY